MTYCAWCGAALPAGDRFCSRCGRPVAAPLPPAPSNFPLHLVIVLLVLFVAGSVLVSAVLYAMTSGLIDGPNTPVRPVVTLTVRTTSYGADILVAGIQPTVAPSYLKVNIVDVSTATFGVAVSMPTYPSMVGVTVGTDAVPTMFSIEWYNPGGSGVLSQGDHFVITYLSGPYSPGTTYAFLLIWSDGSTLTSINWQV
jgi:hypothetical protein